MKNYLEHFLHFHPEYLEGLNIFPNEIKCTIISKLETSDTQANFHSLIAEIEFGKILVSNGFNLDYEKEFPNKQTPDWTISYGNNYAIFEVYRLGQSEKDQIRSDFENELHDKLKQLKYNYHIQIIFKEEYFLYTDYDIDLIVCEFNKWLDLEDRKEKDSVLIFDNFELKILKCNTKIDHLCIVGNCNSVDYKPTKLIQANHLVRQNEITKKIDKYKLLVTELEVPFIISVLIDAYSGFNFDEFIEYFMGQEAEFFDFGTEIGNLPQFNEMGKNWTELGKFYEVDDETKNLKNNHLSGIFILYNNQFMFLPNPNKSQILYNIKNKPLLEALMKYDNTKEI